MKYIDRDAPVYTGDEKKDLKSMMEYLAYLKEQMNYILSLIYKEMK